jgi:hypothetical protein
MLDFGNKWALTTKGERGIKRGFKYLSKKRVDAGERLAAIT